MRARAESVIHATLAFACAAAFLALSCDVALAGCSVPRFSFNFGSESYASMTTDSGVPCTVKLREGRGMIIKSIVTLAAPGKGSVRQLNSVNFAYQARRGFKGEDKFTVGIVGTKDGAPGTARVTVAVWVVGEGSGPPAVASISPARSARVQTAARQPARSARQRQAAAPNALQAKCLQQVGAGVDPVTKRWAFYVTEGDAMSRIDMLRMCLAGGDRAKANRIAVPEIWQTHPGDRGPRQR